MRSSIALIPTALALLVGLAPGVASATPTFPGAIQTDLGLSYTPPCTVCHQTDSGGQGTVVQAFGKAMKMHGLVDADTSSVQTALTAMDSAKVDSDCDGVPDVEQLKEGRDPNTGEYIDGSGKPKPAPVSDAGCGSSSGGGSTDTGPSFGCGAQVAPGSVEGMPWQAAAALAVALGLTLTRRRRA
jgi:hypothetical protein